MLALAVGGNTVYAGGVFFTVGAATRRQIAALDATTGAVLSAWNPDAHVQRVFALAVNGSIVYAGGEFDSIGAAARRHIAALDATTGNATLWNPNADTTVNALALSGNTVYVGGEFNSIGATTRHHVAANDIPAVANEILLQAAQLG